MSTPAFVPQSQDSLIPVRFYTPFDPYFYTVDNRPLQDLSANILAISSLGGDSARRAVLLSQLSACSAFSSLFKADGDLGVVEGMGVSFSNGSLRIGKGALYFTDVVNTEVSATVTKQALLSEDKVFALTGPNPGLGDAKDFLVQLQVRNVSQDNTPESSLPFLDVSNNFLPSLLLNGEACITIKEGVSATNGQQQTPQVDAGHIPLYVVTYTLNAGNSTVRLHPQAPSVRRGKAVTALSSGNVLSGSGDSAVSAPVSLRSQGFSPLLPIRVRVLYTSSTGTGNVAMQVKYTATSVGSLVSGTMALAGQEVITPPAVANTLAEFTTSTAVVPTSAFAGFVNGSWQVNKDVLQVSLFRAGGAGGPLDTSSGDVTVLEVQVFQ